MGTKTTKARTVKAAPKATKPTVERVAAAAAKTLAEFGSPAAAAKAGEAALQTLKRSEDGVRAWHNVARMSVASGQTASEFGKMAGGNPNTRARLIAAADILAASKGKAPFWQAVAIGNGPVAESKRVVAEYRAGRNPLAEVKTTASGKAAKGTGVARKGTKVSAVKVDPTPDQFGAVLRYVLANLDKVTTDSARDDIRATAAEIAASPLVQAKARTATRKASAKRAAA